MRGGCGCGCLTVVLLALLLAGLAWVGSGLFERPSIEHEIGSAADGRRAQQKLFELASRTGRERRTAVTLSEAELNALLVRHLSPDQLPLEEMGIRLVGNGVVEVTGRLPLRAVVGDWLASGVGLLPDRWTSRAVWLRLRGHVRLESGAARADRRTLRLDVAYLAVGRRRLPTAVLGLLPEGPVLRATRWQVPDTIESVTVDPGRLTIANRP